MADESWPADRRPSAAGRYYYVWELFTTEESLPLSNVSFRAPCTAWYCFVYRHYSESNSAAELIKCMCYRMSVSMHPCGSNMSFFSLYGNMCLQFVFHAALCVFFIFTSGCYRSAEGFHSMSSDFACLLNAMRLCFRSGYIKTVNIVAQRNVLCLHIYQPELPKGNMY